jgi:hypothetical protein
LKVLAIRNKQPAPTLCSILGQPNLAIELCRWGRKQFLEVDHEGRQSLSFTVAFRRNLLKQVISIIFVLPKRLPNISTTDRNLYVRPRLGLEYKHSIQIALLTSLTDFIIPFKITILAKDDSKAVPSDQHFARSRIERVLRDARDNL